MKTNPELKLIAAADTYQLRLKILKPADYEYEYQYKGDDLDSTFHIGLYQKNELTCIGSFFENSCPKDDSAKAVQLRGMATNQSSQGTGIGKELLRFACLESKKRGYNLMWCNARIAAIPFYEKIGFKCVSDEFIVPKVGMHRVMKMSL